MNRHLPANKIPTGLFEAMQQVETYLESIPTPYATLELMRLRAAQINGCIYCVEMHHLEAEAAGVTVDKLYSLVTWRESPLFSNKERAALELTETLTLIADHEISEDQLNQLREFFDDTEIANMTLAIAQSNSWNRLAKTFGFEPGHYRVGMYRN